MDKAAYIRRERARRKVSQLELASRLGLWRPTLSEIENGRLEISDEQFHAIIAAIRDLSRERASE
jgi:transcriptional regulator with XRE-family HTH domain